MLTLCLASAAGCTRSTFDDAAWKVRGAEVLAPFKKQLKEALVTGLEKGPTEAIGACRFEAPKIAARLSTSKVKVGRTSHKLRNPDNAPKPWMVPLLDRYLGGASEPMAVKIDATTVGYAEPIMMQPLCLTCHGPSVAPDVAAEIKKLYPSDEAMGFSTGELRGMFWVELSE